MFIVHLEDSALQKEEWTGGKKWIAYSMSAHSFKCWKFIRCRTTHKFVGDRKVKLRSCYIYCKRVCMYVHCSWFMSLSFLSSSLPSPPSSLYGVSLGMSKINVTFYYLSTQTLCVTSFFPFSTSLCFVVVPFSLTLRPWMEHINKIEEKKVATVCATRRAKK